MVNRLEMLDAPVPRVHLSGPVAFAGMRPALVLPLLRVLSTWPGLRLPLVLPLALALPAAGAVLAAALPAGFPSGRSRRCGRRRRHYAAP